MIPSEANAVNKAAPPSHVSVGNREVYTTGKWIKVARICDEELVEGNPVPDAKAFLRELRNTGLGADMFSFAQRLPQTSPAYDYHCEWDNLAVIPISTYRDWWAGLSDPVQRAVKKAKKLGVTLKEVELDDELVRGIQEIYNENPVRQGRLFTHYDEDFDTVKQGNSTYSERSMFLGAYFEGELIGFIRLTTVGAVAEVIQILSKMKHQEKRPTNALIAKAVELCEQKGISYLKYCNYSYNDIDSSLTEFKRRNGFQKMLVPRYYIPLTLKGRVALKLGLHHSLMERIPTPLLTQLRNLRKLWYARRFSQKAA
jgi:hypothetical protein